MSGIGVIGYIFLFILLIVLIFLAMKRKCIGGTLSGSAKKRLTVELRKLKEAGYTLLPQVEDNEIRLEGNIIIIIPDNYPFDSPKIYIKGIQQETLGYSVPKSMVDLLHTILSSERAPRIDMNRIMDQTDLILCQENQLRIATSLSKNFKKLIRQSETDTLDIGNATINTSLIKVFNGNGNYVLEDMGVPRYKYNFIYAAYCFSSHILELPCVGQYVTMEPGEFYEKHLRQDITIFRDKYKVDPSDFTTNTPEKIMVNCQGGIIDFMYEYPSPLRFEFLANLEYLANIGCQIVINLAWFDGDPSKLGRYLEGLGGPTKLLLPFWQRYFRIVDVYYNVLIDMDVDQVHNIIKLEKIQNII